MQDKQWIRGVLWTTAVFNLIAGALFLFPASSLGQWAGVPTGAPAIYTLITVSLVWLFGGAYALRPDVLIRLADVDIRLRPFHSAICGFLFFDLTTRLASGAEHDEKEQPERFTALQIKNSACGRLCRAQTRHHAHTRMEIEVICREPNTSRRHLKNPIQPTYCGSAKPTDRTRPIRLTLSIATAWVTTRVPCFGQFIASGRIEELNQMFRGAFLRSSLLMLAGCTAVCLLSLAMGNAGWSLAGRISSGGRR